MAEYKSQTIPGKQNFAFSDFPFEQNWFVQTRQSKIATLEKLTLKTSLARDCPTFFLLLRDVTLLLPLHPSTTQYEEWKEKEEQGPGGR